MPSQRVILVTGASGGIGRATSIALSNTFPSPAQPEQLVLVLVGRRQAELEETGRQCRDGTLIEVATGDASNEEDVKRIFEIVKSKYGRLDVLFNNAGINDKSPGEFEDQDMDVFRRVLDINIMSAVLFTKHAFRLMKAQEPQGGRIINNGSISATSPRPNNTAYTLSKHAIHGLTRSTSLDGRKYHITCTELDIGNAATDLGSHVKAGSLQADGTKKVEPLMHVDNVAKTVAFIASLPAEADILSLEIIASGMPYVGRG
ncbi:short-chain dehydrogenase/reductase SDR [Cryptococcus gattii Ru294]|nr:short-chain dehydrogenase/reductase SDR [Cryptococcus gattii Ru294]